MLRRLDLGYALNAHMAQGMTKAQAIEVISSSQRNLATQRTQNVLNTRATDDMVVVTNNLEGLKQQLDRTIDNVVSNGHGSARQGGVAPQAVKVCFDFI